jgi:hypothetical protein
MKNLDEDIDDDILRSLDLTKCKIVRRGPPKDRKLPLAFLRGRKGLTQVQIAKRAKISQSEISRAELRSDCLVSTLERYAKALGGELQLTIDLDGRSYPIALHRR